MITIPTMDRGEKPAEPQNPAGFFQFIGASPDGKEWAFFVVEIARVRHFGKTGNTAKAREGWLLPELVESPSSVWINLKREGQIEGLCYCGKPSGRYLDETIELPIPPKMVFAAFIGPQRASRGQFKILKWEWIEESPAEPGFPIDHGGRFGRRLWPPD